MFFKKKYNLLSDEELMVLVTDGKKQAFDELYNRYNGKMLYFLYRMLNHDDEKSQDILQDVFLKVIEKPHLFDTSKKFSTWLYTIASNLCKNEYRKQTVRNIVTNTDSPEDFGSEAESSSRNVDHSMFMDKLEIELNKLSLEHKEVFLLKYKEELSLKEISKIVDCPEGTVKSRLFYTIKKLSNSMKEFQEIYKN